MASEEYFGATDVPLSSTEALTDNSNNKTFGLTFTQLFKVLVGIIGMLGNLTVWLAVIQMQSKEVKFLIGSQAAIDCLTSILLIVSTFYSRFTFSQLVSPDSQFLGSIYCKFWHFDCLVFMFFTVSTYNLVAISIERYLAVLHPIWYRTNFSRKKAIILGCVAWMMAPTMQLVICLGQAGYYIEERRCRWVRLQQPEWGIVGVILVCWNFLGPCIIMAFCFAKIIIELVKQDKTSEQLQASNDIASVSTKIGKNVEQKNRVEKETAGRKRSRNVTNTFLVVFIVFVLCWVFNQVLFLQKHVGGYNHHGSELNYFADGMATLNCAINPFIYVFRFKQYREKMQEMFCSCKMMKS